MAAGHAARRSAIFTASHVLRLAAAPVFAAMALVVAMNGDAMPVMLCAGANDGSSLSGMLPMYLLMSIFHASPWLKLISS